MDEDYHKVSIKDLFEKLGSSPDGISDKEAAERQKKHGKNRLSQKKRTPELIKFLMQFRNFFSILLMIGGILAFVSEALDPGEGSIYIGFSLVGVSILNSVFTYVQERKAERAMDSFRKLMKTRVMVIRGGEKKEIDSEDLVLGDIVVLREGDKIAADARLIEESTLKVDHSSLTGESEPQLRSISHSSELAINSRNMVLSGTYVQSGSGRAIVTCIGDMTEIGKIAKLTQDVGSSESNLQKELGFFIKVMSYIAIILGVAFFIFGAYMGIGVWASLVFGIGIIVANVPEGLLPTVTLTLALAAKRMARENALVKNMDAIETLGAVTVICTDKTGTLTENNMRVSSFMINGRHYDLRDDWTCISGGHDAENMGGIKGSDTMIHALALCNNAEISADDGRLIGDPTETALLEMAKHFKDVHKQREGHKRVYEIPFESGRKYMVTANSYDGRYSVYIKGAPEIVVGKCKDIMINGNQRKMTGDDSSCIIEENRARGKEGKRTLAIAKKDIDGNIFSMSAPEIEKALDRDDFVYVGLVSMMDPPRKEVPGAVKMCKEAGIKIIVISGDQALTVESIARQVEIVEGTNPMILSGEEIRKLSDADLRKHLKEKEILVARALPQDKLRVVSILGEMGEIVAVTGDGVNDAPALKKADVGVAMGKNGTEVAKEAADIVLLDDNFATIVSAIRSGRTVYDNIKKFTLYILTSNIPEIIPFIMFVLFGWPIALPVLLILAIDLGTDMLPAIALGVEKSETDVMKQKPRKRGEKIANFRMFVRSYMVVGPLETVYSYAIFFMILFESGWTWGQDIGVRDPAYMAAIMGFFACIVVCQMFNVFANRTRRQSIFGSGFFTNRLIFIGLASEVLIICLMMFAPPISKVFGTAPFSLSYVPLILLFGSTILLIEEARKYLNRRYGILSID